MKTVKKKKGIVISVSKSYNTLYIEFCLNLKKYKIIIYNNTQGGLTFKMITPTVFLKLMKNKKIKKLVGDVDANNFCELFFDQKILIPKGIFLNAFENLDSEAFLGGEVRKKKLIKAIQIFV